MTHEYRYFKISLVTLLALVTACASSSRSNLRREAESAHIDDLIAQVHVGESRRDVERTLGRPYNVEIDGRETVMIYVSGPADSGDDAQRASANAQVLSGVLGALGSFGGNSLGSAGTIGTQVLGTGASLGSTGSASGSTEQTRIEVRLRGNKVVSVERIDSGRIGIGADR